jgi:hypothetical protein
MATFVCVRASTSLCIMCPRLCLRLRSQFTRAGASSCLRTRTRRKRMRARRHARTSVPYFRPTTGGRSPLICIGCMQSSCLAHGAHDGDGRVRRRRLQATDSSTSLRSSRGSSGAAVSQTPSLLRPRGGFCLATLHQGRVLSEPLPLHRSAPVRSAQRLRALAPARSALGTHLRRRLSALPLPAAVASHPAAFATLGLTVLRPVPPAR